MNKKAMYMEHHKMWSWIVRELATRSDEDIIDLKEEYFRAHKIELPLVACRCFLCAYHNNCSECVIGRISIPCNEPNSWYYFLQRGVADRVHYATLIRDVVLSEMEEEDEQKRGI